MRGALGVVLDDGTGYRRTITRETKGLSFTKVAVGGDHSANCSLNASLAHFPNLGPADSFHIDDAATGNRIFSGYTENPGRRRGGGEGFDLAVQGGMVLARDESRPLVYIDRDSGSWDRETSPAMPPSASTSQGQHPTSLVDEVGWQVQFNPGQPVDTGFFAQVANHSLERANMQFGGLLFNVSGGRIDSDWVTNIVWADAAGGEGTTLVSSLTTALVAGAVDVDSLTALNATRIGLQLYRTGIATNITADDVWAFFDSLTLLGRRINRWGIFLDGTGMGSLSAVYSHQIVEDLLGRLLPHAIDLNTASVATGTVPIDHLTYHDGTTAGGVLDDLSLWEPDMLWQIGAQLPNNRHRFTYRAWPTEQRYEIAPRDHYVAPGGEIDLCNRIVVYWTDSRGFKRSRTVTASVPALGLRTKDAKPITLPDGKGSAGNAQIIGTAALAAAQRPANAGSAVIRRPIYDHLWQRMVMPWEIEPGYLALVQETGDLLRITEMTYNDDDCATKVTLGEPILSDEQRFARLADVS